MARRECDREDLFAEVTALSPRVEFRIGGESVVAGVKRSGNLLIYFRPDFMVGFDVENAVRRAFVDGLLYRAERGRRAAPR